MIGLRAQLVGVIFSALIVVIFIAGTCSGQVLGIRTPDDQVITEQNVLLVQEMRNSASPDAVGPVASLWKRVYAGGTDQPVGILLWNWLGIDDTECISAIADMNDDGYPDVLAENFDSGASGNNFSCLSGHNVGTVQVIWSVHPTGGPSSSGGYGDQCVNTISDLNNDGYDEALLGTAWGGRTAYAINGRTGATIWSYDTYNDPYGSGWIYSIAPISDVNGDSLDDVLAGAGGDCKTAFCFSGANGNILWRYRANDAIGTVHEISDVNGDSIPDAIAGAWGNSADRRIYCFSGASIGTAIVLWQYQTGGDVQHVSSIPDVNNSGFDDVVAASWDDNIYCREGSNGAMIWTAPMGGSGSRAEPIPDVNGDDIYDVFAGGWSNSVRMINGANGATIWSRALPGSNCWTVFPVGDVDDDRIDDVVAGNSVSGGTGGTVYVLSGVDGSIIWDYVTNGWVNTVRGIPDINGDDLNDVIAGNQGGPGPYVWCFEGDTLAGGPPPLPDLVISEFTIISSFDSEVEIYNLTTEAVDLSGMIILQVSPQEVDTAVINVGVTVGGESYQVVNVANSVGLAPAFESGMLILTMPDGTPLDSVGYGGMGGAPAPPMEWSTALDLTSSGMWAERFTLDPTPTWGLANDAPTAQLGVTDVVINEVYPLGGEGDAFVELYNISSQAVDLTGWVIAAGVQFDIPSGVVINPHSYYVLWEGSFPTFFGCEPEGDNIYLMNDSGVRVDQMGWWGGWESDSSWSAVPDGDRTVFNGFDLATCTDFEQAVPTPEGVNVPEPGKNAVQVYSFSLGPAYPNPFNASSRIYYSLERRLPVRLTIHDILGREVVTLVNGQQDAGMHSVVWQADGAASGTYFARLESGSEMRTMKLTLLK